MNKQKPTVLIVDDDLAVRTSIASILGNDYNTIQAVDYDTALNAFENNDVGLTVLDINFNQDKNGLDVLREIKKHDSTAAVIILSAITDTPNVVEAMKLGAFDYITKSCASIENDLMLRIEQCIKRAGELRILESMDASCRGRHAMITQDPRIKNMMTEIEEVGEMNILIEGETGSGKTPLAVYANLVLSDESKRPFVRVNCAGLSRERLQDELFGHKRGAFTGAASDRKGLVELAKDGDLFLDEVGDLDQHCQAELLIFLDSGEFRRLGDPAVRYSNCRIIAASNYDLKQRVTEGKFRADLYSRLAQLKVSVPPLSDRKGDIVPIMEHYISHFCGFQKPYSPSIPELYQKFDWSEGNVRELRDAVMYMCRKSRNDKTIDLKHLNPNYFTQDLCCGEISSIEVKSGSIKDEVMKCGLDTYLSHIEKRVLEQVSSGEKSIRSLAKKLNVVDVTLHRKFKKHSISLT